MENRVKECRLDLFADRTSANTMRANQLRLWFCWVGLLHGSRAKGLLRTKESVFTKTPLWRAALRLETDKIVRGATSH